MERLACVSSRPTPLANLSAAELALYYTFVDAWWTLPGADPRRLEAALLGADFCLDHGREDLAKGWRLREALLAARVGE